MFISVGSKRLVNHVFIFISEKRLISLCVGCGNQIHDQYILRVSPDLEWHAACLKCAECNQYLDESCTCFVRDGKTYCKRDYIRYAASVLLPSSREMSLPLPTPYLFFGVTSPAFLVCLSGVWSAKVT